MSYLYQLKAIRRVHHLHRSKEDEFYNIENCITCTTLKQVQTLCVISFDCPATCAATCQILLFFVLFF